MHSNVMNEIPSTQSTESYEYMAEDRMEDNKVQGAADEFQRKQEHSRVGLAMFGVGRIGKVHLNNLVDDGRSDILWLVDVENMKEQIEKLVEKYHLDKATISCPQLSQSVFNDERVQAVVICNPTPHHEDVIRAALKAGKHVMVEKPIVPSEEIAKELYDLAKSRGLILFCALNRRHDPQLKTIHSAICRGDMGSLHTIKVCSRDPPTQNNAAYIQTSGGMFLDSVVHSFDMVYWLANEKPHSVVAFGHAHCSTYAETDDVDSVVVMLRFNSGLIAVLDNSRHAAYGYDQRVEVMGTNGMIISNNPKQSEVEVFTSTATTQQPTYFQFIDRFEESYKHEVKHFVDALYGKVDIEDSSGEGIVLALRLARLCAESMKTGKVVPV